MNCSKHLSGAKKALFTIALLIMAFGVYAQPSYCTSTLGGSTFDAVITNVSIPGTTLNNPSTGAFTYSAFPISGSTTATLQQGGTYTIVIDDSIGSAAIGMWVDFNQDGIFETYEWFDISTDATGITSATFTVPATAHTGVTGLRIRTEASGYGPVLASDACTDFFTGETQDYYVTIDTTLPCSGTPAVGAITGPSSICPSTDFTLSLSGYTLTTGLTYQWLSHPATGGTFTAIAGATTADYTTSLTASTDYELKITCTASGLSSTSAALDITMLPAILCYCHDSIDLGGFAEETPIDSVSIVGTTLDNWTPSNPHIYASYPASGSTTATLHQGATYTIVVNATDPFSDPADVSMWIDYNHSGTYDPVEWTSVGFDVVGNSIATFTVPLTADTGLTGLRIRTIAIFVDSALGAGDACVGPYNSGETQDYLVTIDTTYPCSGLPAAGIINGPDSVCPAQTFTLSATGYTIATGLTYQWLSATGLGSYAAVPGATDLTYVVTGQTVPTTYAFVVKCTGSGLSDTTIKFTVGELPFTRCYCDSASLGGEAFNAPIDSVAIVGTTLNNYTPANPNTYSAFPASGSTTATLTQGGYYTIVVNSNDGVDPATSSLWIDYNHSGTYDPVEWTLVGTDILGTATAVFNVPLTALTGLTGMRIRTINPDFDVMGAGDACTDFTSGETEDYLITIDTALPCTGTPTAGSITGPDSVCNSISFTLTLGGYPTSAGITFQWQSRPAGTGSFTPIAGATTPVYTSGGITAATDYNVVVTCSNSGLSATSATFAVTMKSFLNCYCSPATGVTLFSFQGEDEISQAKITGTSFNATGITVPISGYVQIPPTPASNTADLHIGSGYNYVVTIDSDFYFPESVAAWIDYNQNGIYDPAEFISLVSDGLGGTFTGSFTIPSGTLTGQTGMRILSSDDVFIVGTEPCENFEVGEAADFIVTIAVNNEVKTIGNSDFSMRAYPNPVNSSVTIQTFGIPGNNRNIILTDITGRTIKQVPVSSDQTVIDLSALDPGIYLIKYEDDVHAKVVKINKQ